jgi:putative ABC transport system permease protein
MSIFNVFRRRRHEREMDDEMRFHVDMEAAELERAGVPPDEARRRALAAFGGVQRYKEEGQESRGGTQIESLVRDAKYAVRSLRRTPGHALVVLLTIALGVAANSAIFGVAHGIVFKPLPYRDPARLISIWDGLEMIGVPEAWVTGPEVVALRERARSFEGFAAIRLASTTVGSTGDAEPLQVPLTFVSANFFQVLGAGPTQGRGFAPGEDALGAPRAAVISRRLWVQRFGGDPAIVGRQGGVLLDGVPTTIVGILPTSFNFSAQNSLSSAAGTADVYVPLTDTLARMRTNGHSLGVLARVRSNVPVRAALDELAAVGKQLDSAIYNKGGFSFKPIVLQERMVREVRPALLALLGAVGLLMLIMCANLAVLALVRAARREREITVRRAIGASHGRISRQILTETVLLSLGGAALGTLLGSWFLRALLSMAPPGLPRRSEIGIDATVVLVTVAVALVLGVVMGLVPVLHSVRADISAVLREKMPSRSGRGVRRSLVLAQLTLSMVLLAGTGLLLRSFMNLLRVDPGFRAANVLNVELVASRAKYAGREDVLNAYDRYIEVLRAMPGVVAVGPAGAPPLSAGTNQSGARFPGAPGNPPPGTPDGVLVDAAPIGPGYLRAMGINLLEGSDFDASHRDTTRMRVTIIDDLLARKYFPRGGAIGAPMILDGDSLRVVGIARHVSMYGLHVEGREQVWVPYSYLPWRYAVFALRTAGEPTALAAAARQAIRNVDRDQAIMSVAPMTDAVRSSLAERRLVLTLVAAFALAALLLAMLGVYGVTASAVTQRTRELGIRSALGADRRQLVWSVASEPARLVAIGLVLGLALTLAGGRVVRSLLYGMSPTDPLTLAAVALVLLIVAIVATWLPARRATRVDPMIALRAE